MKQGNHVVIKEVRKDSSLTDEQRRHFEKSLQHNHELMKRLAQM